MTRTLILYDSPRKKNTSENAHHSSPLFGAAISKLFSSFDGHGV